MRICNEVSRIVDEEARTNRHTKTKLIIGANNGANAVIGMIYHLPKAQRPFFLGSWVRGLFLCIQER